MTQTDYLIFGSGVAGLTFAIKIATHFPEKKIIIITKSNAAESNTKYAQGGIAVVLNQIEDNFQKHVDDTLICGDGLCKKEVVKVFIPNISDISYANFNICNVLILRWQLKSKLR